MKVLAQCCSVIRSFVWNVAVVPAVRLLLHNNHCCMRYCCCPMLCGDWEKCWMLFLVSRVAALQKNGEEGWKQRVRKDLEKDSSVTYRQKVRHSLQPASLLSVANAKYNYYLNKLCATYSVFSNKNKLKLKLWKAIIGQIELLVATTGIPATTLLMCLRGVHVRIIMHPRHPGMHIAIDS